jgi:glycosyltransferase involved in cell wall biosynthesis
MTPVVSVTIPSYNHEKFVGECIQSVLNQTFQDFEIIIIDDGSSDRTVEVIQAFDDPRIKLFRHFTNKGACVAANQCILNSNGRYIAMLSSDDAWYPDKLELQVKYLEQHSEIAVVFGKVDWINETGKLITDISFPYYDVFNVKNRSRHQWLNHFFNWGNCLCHPCSLVRREVYDNVGFLNPAFANLPDLDLWIRICLKYEIAILDNRLIRFRRMIGESNASGDTSKNRIRNRFEFFRILDDYLRIDDVKEFSLTFPEAMKYGKLKAEIIPYFLGRLAIDSGVDFKVLWGLNKIYTLLQCNETAKLVEDCCNFTYRDFIRLSGDNDPFRISWVAPENNEGVLVRPKLRYQISTLVVSFLVKIRNSSPDWLKKIIKKTLWKIKSNQKLLIFIRKHSPGFLLRIYYRVSSSQDAN